MTSPANGMKNSGSSQPEPAPQTSPRGGKLDGPRLSFVAWFRWVWRQLTSMRVALMLLLTLAIAALPGSILPQRPVDPTEVTQYLEENPTWGPFLDRLGFFDVFTSAWFSAVYLLLFISLVGCILPRVKVHVRALRTNPPKPPKHFTRFRARQEFELEGDAQGIAERAEEILKRRHRAYRLNEGSGDGATSFAVTAERGYLRETGNIIFHLGLVALLIAMAASHLLTYRGQAMVLEGRGFANAVVDYDSFESGAWVDASNLAPYSFVLDEFESEFTSDAEARDFTASVTVTDPDGEESQGEIKVNYPLNLGGTKVFLSGNGYAPDVTVRTAEGDVAYAGPIPFLPQDGVYTSQGVIKVPDTGGEQLGLVGSLLPTAQVLPEGARSVHPQPLAPLLVLTLWAGDLGLDSGVPQNVYELDARDMKQVSEDGEFMTEGATASTITAEPGDKIDLPGDYGTLEFHGLKRFVALDVRHDPAVVWVLVAALIAIGGLVTSLFTPRRRIWLRATYIGDGRSLVEVAGLTRSEDLGLEPAIEQFISQLRNDLGQPAGGDE